MNNVQEFKFETLPLNVIDKAGEPWFIAKEVCEILEISNTSKAVEGLDEDELTKSYTIDSLGRNQEVLIISESGLYTLIIRSNKPKAKEFRKWVTGVVLPSIRKTGGYGISGKDNVLINLYEKVIDLQSQVMVLQEKVSNIQIGQLMCRQDKYNSERFRKEIIRLYNDGYSTRVIAKMFGVSINKVLEILQIEIY